MNSDEKTQIKAQIQAKIKETKARIQQLQETSKPVSPDNAIGRLTRMDAIQQKSVSDANLETAQATLEKLEEALTKVDSERFGVCTRCKRDIPIERILLMPEVTRCVNCADALF